MCTAIVVLQRQWDILEVRIGGLKHKETGMSTRKTNRRSWPAKEKLRIVLAGMEPDIEISELCRREGLSPTQYYNWKSQLVSSADAVFGDRRTKKNGQAPVDPREQELTKLRGVIAEITAENLELKKTRSD